MSRGTEPAPPERATPLKQVMQSLSLVDTGARTSEDIFTASSQWMPHGRVYGGQVLAQSVLAAARTVAGDRAIHSLHGYFLRPGDIATPITFSVDRIHDGRSFSTRRTQAYQDGQPIYSMIASFQDADPGLDHQISMPSGVPEPESLPTVADTIGEIPEGTARSWASARPFDIRHVPAPIYTAVEGDHVAHQAVWLRAVGAFDGDETLHRAALAYASDHTILEPVLRRHGIPWSTRGLKIASLDHAMWWHRPVRVDSWLLYVQESPTATGGRGLGMGRVYTRDGALVASVAQEGMIRVPGVE